jgi:large subunit ribosomal protein L19
MKQAAIERIEAAYMVKDRAVFHVGDTVDVGVKIQEGDKERIQVFTGIVIARRGGGGTETFTTRRIVAGEGVERTFPLHAPSVSFIRVVRSGRVRRAKLHFLRKRTGKATRLEQMRRELGVVPGTTAAEAGPAVAAEAPEGASGQAEGKA